MKPENVLSPEERKSKILEFISLNESVNVLELSEYFSVTGATVRNDLRELETQNKLIRTHGGAVGLMKRGFEDKPENRSNLREKMIIAREALRYISDGDSFMIDTGTTNYELAKMISKSGYKRLRAITNDTLIAQILEENNEIEVVIAGGVMRNQYHCTLGYQTVKFLQQFSVDKAFLGASSISVNGGLATPNIAVSEVKEVMIAQAKQTIILCDSSKFGKRTFRKYAALDGVDVIITDDGLGATYRGILAQLDVEVILAEESKP